MWVSGSLDFGRDQALRAGIPKSSAVGLADLMLEYEWICQVLTFGRMLYGVAAARIILALTSSATR